MAKKSAKKTINKKGKHLAVLTLRIGKDEKHKIKQLEQLCEVYGCKSYTDAIYRAINDVNIQRGELILVRGELNKLKHDLRNANDFKERFTSLVKLATVGEQDDDNGTQKECPHCEQMYIDDGNGCPDCD